MAKKHTGLTKHGKTFQRQALRRVDPGPYYRDLLKIPQKDISAFQKGLKQFIDPSEKQMMREFQTGVVDPTMQRFQQQVVPGIQERFAGEGLSSSSALNQALASAAGDVSTQMGSMLPGFMESQRGMKMQALGMLPGMRGQFYSPMMQGLGQLGSMAMGQPMTTVSQPGIGQALGHGAANIGMMAAAAKFLPMIAGAFSSKDVKENIKDFDKGLEEIEKMQVKSYDYKEGYGDKNRIGVIAEDAPAEVKTKLSGVNAVDLYGIISLLVNSVKELNEKVKKLEA